MGTTFSVIIVSPPESLELGLLQTLVQQKMGNIESSMSTYIADSEVSRFNTFQGTEWFPVTMELCELVDLALTIGRITGGAFDITIGPVVDQWGFGPKQRGASIPGDDEIRDMLGSTGIDKVETSCNDSAIRKESAGVGIDLSGIAKGYAVDQVSVLLETHGVHNYLVEIGGEIRIAGNNQKNMPWSIAVEHPNASSRAAQTVLLLSDSSVASSGDYRNNFEFGGVIYSHTIDPRNGYPITHATSAVTVIKASAAQADAFATAFLVLGLDEGLKLAEREKIAAIFLIKDGGKIVEKRSSAVSHYIN